MDSHLSLGRRVVEEELEGYRIVLQTGIVRQVEGVAVAAVGTVSMAARSRKESGRSVVKCGC